MIIRVTLFATLFIQLFLLISAGSLRGQYVNGFDGTGYYSWIRSLALDKDLSFKNEFQIYNPHGSAPDPDHVYPKTGLTRNQYSAGFPFLCAPGFLIGQLISTYGPDHWRSDGYGMAPQIGYVINAFIWYALGIVLFFKFLSARFSSLVAMSLTLLAAWGTTAGYYAWSEPFYAQSVEFFTVMLWISWVYSKKIKTSRNIIYGGLILALMVWVRLDNAIFSILILDWVKQLPREKRISKLLICCSATIVGLIPHYVLRILISGEFSLIGGYGPSDNIVHGHTFSNLLNPNIHKVLFATNNGLIFWCPLLIFGLVGLINFWKSHSPPLALVVILKIYLVSSWLAWDGSASMGPRALTGILPIFLWIIAVESKRAPWLERSLVGLTLMSSLWFTGLVYQRFSDQLPYYENFSNLRDYPYQRVFNYQITNLKDLVTDPQKSLSRLRR